MLHRADRAIDLAERFEGRGRIVLTASSAMEYAFEDAALSQAEGQPSVFTRALVQGLKTGDADRDGDGHISVDELYDYVFDQVRTVNPKQTLGRWDFELQGDFLIASNRHLRPVALPPELQQALEHPVAGVRLGASTSWRTCSRAAIRGRRSPPTRPWSAFRATTASGCSRRLRPRWRPPSAWSSSSGLGGTGTPRPGRPRSPPPIGHRPGLGRVIPPADSPGHPRPVRHPAGR